MICCALLSDQQNYSGLIKGNPKQKYSKCCTDDGHVIPTDVQSQYSYNK